MRTLRGTYVRRGDIERRRLRAWRAFLLVALVGAVTTVAATRGPLVALAEPQGEAEATFDVASIPTDARLRQDLEAARGALDLAHAQLRRWEQIAAFSARYSIGADLSGLIYDAAMAEGIAPEVAFQLVRIESEFKTRAVSPVGAVGLTQLMPATARYFDRNITRERLHDPATNLRIGFRYLRGLIKEQKGDVSMALSLIHI